MYDVAVIGAGPAGSTLARLLADHCRVLLLDSGQSKCCGGILAPFAQAMLRQFGLEIPREVLVVPQPPSVAVWDLNANIVRHYARQYINVDRAKFDQWLLSLVPPSVCIQHNARYIKSEASSDGLTFQYKIDGEIHTERTRYLIGADGAFSTVRREFFAQQIFPKRYTAVQETYSCAGWKTEKIDCAQEYTGLFDSEVTDFYAWTIPKDDYLLLGLAVPFGKNPRQNFNRLKEKLHQRGLPVFQDKPVYQQAGLMFRPLRFHSMFAGSGNVALIGEAAGFISPSSAEGIGSALSSAYMLSESYEENGGLNGKKYRMLLQKLRWKLWLKNVKIPVMFSPPLRKLVLLSGLTSIKRR